MAPSGLIVSRGRYSFLSEQLEKSEDLSSKPFGFGSKRIKQWLSAPAALELRVTALAPPLGAGQGARKQPRL